MTDNPDQNSTEAAPESKTSSISDDQAQAVTSAEASVEVPPAAEATPPPRILRYADADLEKEIRAKAEKLGVKVEELLMLPMTHEDILYLLDTCPYLQIVNSESNADMTPLPKFIEAQSGWLIYDYGDAMCSSPGDLLFADNSPDPAFLYGLGTRRQTTGKENEEEGGTGRGTILKQSVDTAAEMIFLAMQRGWKGVTLVEGHPRMKWAAWVMAGDHDYDLQGYEPSKEDLERRKRLRRSRSEIDDLYMRAQKNTVKSTI